jgi:hypothetical protein
MEQPKRLDAVGEQFILLERAMGIELYSQILSLNNARRCRHSKSQLVPSGANSENGSGRNELSYWTDAYVGAPENPRQIQTIIAPEPRQQPYNTNGNTATNNSKKNQNRLKNSTPDHISTLL